MPKIVHFGEFLKLAVKQSYQTGHAKIKKSNATFWLIFKHCETMKALENVNNFGKLLTPRTVLRTIYFNFLGIVFFIDLQFEDLHKPKNNNI